MEKKFTRSKIIILSIAILVAILTFSIGIFGFVNKNNKNNENNQSEAATENYLLRNGGAYSTTWNELTLYVEMDDYKIVYYKDDNPSLIVNLSGAVYLDSGEKYDSYDVGDHYDITEASVDYCYVKNDYGLSLFNAFKNNGNAVIPCRYTKTGTLFGWGNEDTTTTLNKAFNLNKYSLDGSINITIGGQTYTKSYSYRDGLRYKMGNQVILSCSEDKNGIIKTGEGLKLFAHEMLNDVCYGNELLIDSYMSLTDNLNMASVSNMIPIGTKYIPFKGTFNGNGYTISNLNLQLYTNSSQKEASYGLFAYISGAEIRNLSIKDSKIVINNNNIYLSQSGFYKAGILVGEMSGSYSTISSCMVINSSIELSDEVSVEGCVLGGMVGYVKEKTNLYMDNCRSTTTLKVMGYQVDSNLWLGGLVGVFEPSQSNESTNILSIEDSYFYGNVIVENSLEPDTNKDRHSGANITIGGILAEATRYFSNNNGMGPGQRIYIYNIRGEVVNVRITINKCFAKFNTLSVWTSSGSTDTLFGQAYEDHHKRIVTIYNISCVLKKVGCLEGGLYYSGNYTDYANSQKVEINVLSDDKKSCSDVNINETSHALDPYSYNSTITSGNKMPADIYTFGADINENLMP